MGCDEGKGREGKERKGKAMATYQTPIKSMSTSIENAFLNAVLCDQPTSSVREYILYANGICWRLCAGRSPTLCSMPARARAVYAPRENPNRHILSPASSEWEKEWAGL